MPPTSQEQPLGAAVASVAGDKDPSRVVHTLVNELAKLGFLCWLIAWALSSTSAADSLAFWRWSIAAAVCNAKHAAQAPASPSG